MYFNCCQLLYTCVCIFIGNAWRPITHPHPRNTHMHAHTYLDNHIQYLLSSKVSLTQPHTALCIAHILTPPPPLTHTHTHTQDSQEEGVPDDDDYKSAEDNLTSANEMDDPSIGNYEESADDMPSVEHVDSSYIPPAEVVETVPDDVMSNRQDLQTPDVQSNMLGWALIRIQIFTCCCI